MANNKIACRAGKTALVDPNNFDGQNSSSNISVPLEDLSITVQLETNKKARTILTSTGNKNINFSSAGAKVKFIEGNDVGGKKVLTTSYTDLTTSFEQESDSEALGITSIDIEFNTSNAPLIVINFIDLRGSAIFQNDNYISEGKNKYASFFQMPYPLFKLTVKGYYGLPVEYELHLTKFNSKFNSKTGNFEITANFVGYTYAMLSDMLIGYLKAIPYTKLGAERYEKLRSLSPTKLLTLDELMIAISEIDSAGKKLKETDQGIGDLNRANNKLDSELNAIKSILFVFGQQVDIKNDLDEYKFVIPRDNVDIDKATKYYNDAIKNNVEIFNQNPINNVTINENDLNMASVRKYEALDVNMLNPFSSTTQSLLVKFNGLKESEVEETRIALFEYLKKNGINTSVNVYDFTKQHEKISEIETKLKAEIELLKENAGILLKNKIQEIIGINPTIRNIVEIFTSSVEVFMSVLFDVSKSTINSQPRENELKLFGPSNTNTNSYDIKLSSLQNVDATASSGALKPLYYPWPEYRKNDTKKGLVETYLGEAGVLKNPSNVEELAFIDDLLRAFLLSKKKSEFAEINGKYLDNNWFPINPVDTRLFIDKFPYTRINGNSREDVIALMLIRAITYLGYTNEKLTKEEIEAVANAEADSLLSDTQNDIIIQSLSQLTLDEVVGITATNGNNVYPILKYLGISNNGNGNQSDNYYYNYISEDNNSTVSVVDAQKKHLIPISFSSNGKLDNNYDLSKSLLKAESGNVFLTNYVNLVPNNQGVFQFERPDDGGIYVKFFTPNEYKASIKTIGSSEVNNVLNLETFSKSKEEFNENLSEAGFNQFAGSYGIQEYKTLNYGVEGLETGEFRFMFYNNTKYRTEENEKGNDNEVYSKPTSISTKRISGTKTEYDITGSSYRVIEKTFNNAAEEIAAFATGAFLLENSEVDNIIKYTVGSKRIHERLGENRQLLTEYLSNKSGNISIPFINFQIIVDTDDNNVGVSDDSVPVGLFGSRLYYGQTNDYSRAFLFLHTLPWNGFISDGGDTPKGIFSLNEILNTFSHRGGFVSLPKLWVAFIGGLLWRYSEKPLEQGGSGPNDPIIWVSGSESLIPTYGENTTRPQRNQYITANFDSDFQSAPMIFPDSGPSISRGYKDIEDILLQLPEQVKNEFKKVFFNFVKTEDTTPSEWDILSSYLEVYNDSPDNWLTAWDDILRPQAQGGGSFYSTTLGSLTGDFFLNTTFVESKFSAQHDGKLTFRDYIIFSPIKDTDGFKYNYVTELKDNSDGVKYLLSLMSDELYMSNSTYKIWQQYPYATTNTVGIYATKDDLETYINVILNKLKPLRTSSKEKQRKQEIFGTDNDNLIKLQLYRTCKNIYDKWIGGSDSFESIIMSNTNNTVTNAIATKYGRTGNTWLIDTFRFVNRSFKDIGDDLYVNPLPVADALKNNPNSSFYNVVTNLLTVNNFNFTPLPTFIDYKDEENLKTIFEPMTSIDGFRNGSVGPSFVCVYVGQPSKYLDFKDSEYPDDGVNFQCDDNGNLIIGSAKDFSATAEEHENSVAVFAVNYSQQNQNLFKDITLDQNEFTETDESLRITDDIANKGAENRKTFGGQDMYNVYSVRSYKAEVEMMGNAMIQPMMYFQLNNIPMFRGAYLITRVKHSIKPNNMLTTFSGVRIRNVETPLLNASDLYMSLLDSIEVSETSNFGTGSTTSNGSGTNTFSGNYVPRYYNILLDIKKTVFATMLKYSDSTELVIEGSTIPKKEKLRDVALQQIVNWKSGALKESDGIQFLDEYAKTTPGPTAIEFGTNKQPWSASFISYIMFAGDDSFPKSALHFDYVTAAMNGVKGYEVFPLNSGLKIRPEIGDILCKARSGGNTNSHCDVIYKVENNIAYLIGGNISNTIFLGEIPLNDGYFDDTTKFSGYKLLVKKTDNKYYANKKLTNISISEETNGNVNTQTGCPAVSKNKPFVNAKSLKSRIDSLFNNGPCGAGRDCVGSLDGLKQVTDLYSNGKLTKKGVIAMSFGVTEGFGSSPTRRNPGNIRSGNSYAVYSTWKEGWEAFTYKYLQKWVDGKVTPTASAKYPNCYKVETNKVFLNSGIPYKEESDYNYVSLNSPTLRQFINIYAPWGDNNNPSNYIAGVAATLKDYGYVVNVDDLMNNWV